MLPTKFGVNWPFGSGEEAKNRFSRWLPWRPSWFYDRHDFSYFWSTSHPDASYQVWSQLAFRFRRRSEKYLGIFNRKKVWHFMWTVYLADESDRMSSLNSVFSFNKHVKQPQRQQIQVVSRQFIQCAVGKYLDQPAQSHILSMALRYTGIFSRFHIIHIYLTI